MTWDGAVQASAQSSALRAGVGLWRQESRRWGGEVARSAACSRVIFWTLSRRSLGSRFMQGEAGSLRHAGPTNTDALRGKAQRMVGTAELRNKERRQAQRRG